MLPEKARQDIDIYIELGAPGAAAAAARGGVVVVIDALRASATICAAFAAAQMASVRVVERAEDCIGEITAGERGGAKLPHVRHGNSPVEMAKQRYVGKELVLTTSNGAKCVLAAAGPRTAVLIGTTVNATAVAALAERLAAERREPISLIKAGHYRPEGYEEGYEEGWEETSEDALAAAVIADKIAKLARQSQRQVRVHGALPLVPEAPGLLEEAFRQSVSAGYLNQLGYAEDVDFCARIDIYAIVPYYRAGTGYEDGRLVPWS